MGIEPTRDFVEPHTGFEDQERHQAARHLQPTSSRRPPWAGALDFHRAVSRPYFAKYARRFQGKLNPTGAEGRTTKIFACLGRDGALRRPDAAARRPYLRRVLSGVPPGEAPAHGGGTPPKPAGEDACATLYHPPWPPPHVRRLLTPEQRPAGAGGGSLGVWSR